MIEYSGPGIFKGLGENTRSVSAYVGETRYNLHALVGKSITITEGEFVYSNKQSIMDDCVDLFGNQIVINIEKIKPL